MQEPSSSCPRCGKPIVHGDCTEEDRHPECKEKPIVAGAHLHWRCRACGLAWVEMFEQDVTTTCPVCKTDLAQELSQVPEVVAKGSFPFRCPHCLELLLVRPSPEGLSLRYFPLGEIEEARFEKGKGSAADQAS